MMSPRVVIGESASKAADEAAKRAEQSSRQLAAGISATLSRLTQAAHVVRQVADLAGVDHDSRTGIGITAAQQGLAGAASGASLGAAIGSFVPGVGNAAGAVIGGVIGGGIGALHSINEAEKRIEEAAKRGTQKALRESSGRDSDDAIGNMLREAGLAKFSNHTYGGSRE